MILQSKNTGLFHNVTLLNSVLYKINFNRYYHFSNTYFAVYNATLFYKSHVIFVCIICYATAHYPITVLAVKL